MLLWDFWGSDGRALQRCVGKDGGTLRQAYAIEAARRAMLKRGMRVMVEVRLPSGAVKLVAEQR